MTIGARNESKSSIRDPSSDERRPLRESRDIAEASEAQGAENEGTPREPCKAEVMHGRPTEPTVSVRTVPKVKVRQDLPWRVFGDCSESRLA